MPLLAPKLGCAVCVVSLVNVKMSASSQMTRELNKQGWGRRRDAGGDSDSSDLLSPEFPRSDPTPSQGHKKQDTRVVRHLNFGGSSGSEEDNIENELDEPTRKHSRVTVDQATQKEASTSAVGTRIDQQLAVLEEVKKTNSELSGVITTSVH